MKKVILLTLLLCSQLEADNPVKDSFSVSDITLCALVQLSKEQVSQHDSSRLLSLSSAELFEYFAGVMITFDNDEFYKTVPIIITSMFLSNRLINLVKKIGKDYFKDSPKIKKSLETLVIAFTKNLFINCGISFKKTYL